MNAADRDLVGELINEWIRSSALSDELHERIAELAGRLFPRHADEAERIAREAVAVVAEAIEQNRGAGPKRIGQRARGALLRYLLNEGVELAIRRQ